MERIRDSIPASCSSPFNSPTGFSFKRRPTYQINDGDGQADLLKETATITIPDRAARKEIERQRLRKLLNQGKKKRRRLNANKFVPSPINGATTVTSFTHCHSITNNSAHVPRKSRSVGNRRKGNSWRSIGFSNGQLHPPVLSLQNEIEIEFEIAEVLYGLQKQDEPPIDDLENEDNQSIAVHGCTVDTMSKSESIKYDKDVSKQKVFKAEEGYILSSNPVSNGSNLTSEVPATTMEETESKQPEKFVIDLNELPPMESSSEGDGMERMTSNAKVVFKEEVKSTEPEEATLRRLVQKEMVDENHLPWKMERKAELHDLDLTNNKPKQQFRKQQKAYYYNTAIASDLQFCSQNIKKENNSTPTSSVKITDEQAGRTMAGSPFSFPPNQNVRYSYPIGASFLSVLPGNVNTSSDGKRMRYIGGNNVHPVPYLDGQLQPSQKFLPIQIHQQKHLPFTTQEIVGGQRTVASQSLFPVHSPNVASMPSASGGDGQWKYTERRDLKSEETHNSTSLFSFASSIHSPSMDATGLDFNFSAAQYPVVVPNILHKTNPSFQIQPADHGLQHRSSEMIQNINQTNFDASNYKMSFAKQNAFAKFRLSNRNHSPLQTMPTSVQLQNPQQQVLQAMAASQLKVVPTVNYQHQPGKPAAKLSNEFSLFSGNYFDRSSHSLQQQTSDVKQASDVLRT